jgi:hypothetical protein
MFASIKSISIFDPLKAIKHNIKSNKMNSIKSNVYEVKVNRNWTKVRATSMIALSQWCKENSIQDFRSVGMMSRAEIAESQSFNVVA